MTGKAKITHEQLREELEAGKTKAQIAKEYGMGERAVFSRIARLKASGYDPDNGRRHKNPEEQLAKGYSTLVRRKDKSDESEGVVLEWIKTSVDKGKQYEAIVSHVENLTAEIPSRPPIKEYRHGASDLANQMTFTDYHIAGYAWEAEGGADWDMEIASDMGKRATVDMLSRCPEAETLIINQLGDWAHFDSLLNVTPTSGHVVASHGSPEQMINICIDLLDFMITEGLRTHKFVKVIIAQGNHDLFSSIIIRRAFTRLYRDEPRVEIINNEVPFYAIKFGRNLLGYHHGHKVKFDQLPALFANEFRHMMGDTDRTLIHMGHYHHKHIKEIGKTTVEMHRTLSARDSHASYGGYHSDRATDLITYHKEYGEVGRISVTPAMLGM